MSAYTSVKAATPAYPIQESVRTRTLSAMMPDGK